MFSLRVDTYVYILFIADVIGYVISYVIADTPIFGVGVGAVCD